MVIKKYVLITFLIYLGFFITIIIFCFSVIDRLSSTEVLFLIYNQESLGINIAESFIYSLLYPFLGFLIGVFLSFILLIIMLKLKKRKNTSLDLIDFGEHSNFLLSTWKQSFIVSLFSFNIAFLLLNFPNILSNLVNDIYMQGAVLSQIYGFFAILPYSILIASSIYSAIWLISYCDIYYSKEVNGEIIHRQNIAQFYGDLLKNYSELSSILLIISLTFDYYNDVINLGINISIAYFFVFPAYILLVCPLYFFILRFLVRKVKFLKNYSRKKIS